MTQPTPVIFDDDGSQDGMTALAFMLENSKFDLKAITIAQGIARPPVFVDNLKKMLGRVGNTDIPVGVGRSTPLEGNNEFPDFIRDGSDTFWTPFVTLPDETPEIETTNAVDLIIQTIKNSPEPVAILATGPLTNIAEALRQDPSIVDNIAVVQILGGAVFVPGNLPILPFPPFSTNTTAEFNIWIDPVAAKEVFDAGKQGLKIQLTPLDATNQVQFDRDDYEAWLATGTPESAIAAEFLDFALTVIQSGNDPNPVWDLIAALNLSEPNYTPEVPLFIDVDTTTAPGESQGRTFNVPGLPPNVLVQLNPDFDNISFDAASVFKSLIVPPKDRISGTAANNTLVGKQATEIIKGLDGNDIIYGNGGEDFLLGDAGNDKIFGSSSNEYIGGDTGNDTIYGNGGEDTITGGAGNDVIYGGSQADRIISGTGNDVVYGNGGNDWIDTGAGLDTVWLGSGVSTVVLSSGEGHDIIKNFQLNATKFKVSSTDGLSFSNSSDGAQIFQGQDLLAVVSWQRAGTFSNNVEKIFVV